MSQLQRNEAHLWSVALDDPVWAQTSFCVLSQEEQQKGKRFLQKRDQRRYMAAHAALRMVLAAQLGIRAHDVTFKFGPSGKPALADKIDVEFNLSHSADLALIAICETGRVGVDVEEVRSGLIESGVADRFLSPNEQLKLRLLPPEEKVRAFFRCWTRKEAYLKAVGCGISDGDLTTVEVTLLPTEPAAIIQGLPGEGASERWDMAELNPAPGYAAALVVEQKGVAIIHHTWAQGA